MALNKKLDLNDITFNTNLIQDPDDIIKHILCSYCNNLLINVAFCGSCRISYCGKCSSTLKVCKSCEQSLQSQPNFVLLSKNFKIACPSESECDTVCQVNDLEEHINSCSFITLTTCNGCGVRDIKPQVDRHIKECPDVTLKCEHCSNDFKRSDIEGHKVNCSFRPVTCEHCGDSFRLISFLDHSSSKCIFSCVKKLKTELAGVKEELKTQKELVRKLTQKVFPQSEQLLGRKRLRFINSSNASLENDDSLQIGRPKLIEEKKNEITCLLMLKAANNLIIVSGGSDGLLRVWDILGLTCFIKEHGHDKNINSLIKYKSGAGSDLTLLSCGNDGNIVYWNIGDGTLLKKKLTVHDFSSGINALAQFSDGCIAWAGKSKTLYIKKDFTRESSKQLFQGHAGTIYSLIIIKKDGVELIASGSADKTIKLWNRNSEKALKTFHGHSGTVCHLSILNGPNQTLMSSSYDKTARLWDINSGACLSVFREHDNSVYSVVDISVNNMIVTCSSDKTVKIWDRLGKQCLKTLNASSVLKCLAVYKNGEEVFILAGGFEKIYIWKHLFENQVNNINNIN
jgi:WD40 repeat protein